MLPTVQRIDSGEYMSHLNSVGVPTNRCRRLDERTEAIRQQLGLEAGDACFFVAGAPEKFVKFAGAARTRAGEELNLVDRDRF